MSPRKALPRPSTRGAQPRPIRLGAYAVSPAYYRSGLNRRIAVDRRVDFTAIFSSSAGIRAAELGYGRPVAFDADALSDFRSVFLRRADRTGQDNSLTSPLDLDIAPMIRRERFDVLWLHGYYSPSHLIAAATQVARGGRLLFREEQTLLSRRSAWKTALKKPLLGLLFARSAGLFIGTSNRAWFRHYGIPDERLFHVPYCVDNDRFRAEAQRLAPFRRQLRQAFGIPSDGRPVILSVGRFVPKKQPLVVLDAFRKVRAGARCTLLIVGSGECEGAMRRFVEVHAVPDVVFAGFLNQSEISRAYAAADVFALASGWDETWGLVVNEAMNFGLPVVVSDKVGCAADLVTQGESGYVFPHDRPDELARHLALLVGDSAQRESFGRRAIETITPWNDDLAAEGLLAAVRAAVGEQRWSEAEDGARADLATTPLGDPETPMEWRSMVLGE